MNKFLKINPVFYSEDFAAIKCYWRFEQHQVDFEVRNFKKLFIQMEKKKKSLLDE